MAAYGLPVELEELPGRKSTRVSDTLPGAVLADNPGGMSTSPG